MYVDLSNELELIPEITTSFNPRSPQSQAAIEVGGEAAMKRKQTARRRSPARRPGKIVRQPHGQAKPVFGARLSEPEGTVTTQLCRGPTSTIRTPPIPGRFHPPRRPENSPRKLVKKNLRDLDFGRQAAGPAAF
jgi:hypothetical protein